MFIHVMVGANDLAASRRFYDAALGSLGMDRGVADDRGRIWWLTGRSAFAITEPIDGAQASPANGGTIGFWASDTGAVDRFHANGLAHGGSLCEDPPGPRTVGAFGDMYVAYLRDPSGNKICAIHGAVRPVTADRQVEHRSSTEVPGSPA